MVVLHGSVDDGRLLVWGEVPAEVATAPVKRRGRKRRGSVQVQEVQPSPHDAGAERLSKALEEAAAGLAIKPAGGEAATAWLPSRDGRPLASSPLIAEQPEPGAGAELAPWAVTVFRLSPGQAVDLLCACVDKETLAPGVIVGKTLAFWTAVLRFAGALVARQQFLPGEDANVQPPRARWEPVLAGADVQRLAALARAMPSACRAVGQSVDGPPTTPAASALAAFLNEVVDHLVRSALPSSPVALARRRPARAADFDSLHDQWVHALRGPEDTLHGDGAELARLADQVREWRRPIAVSTAAPFRLCFRLEEPSEEPDVEPEGQPAGNGNQRPWYVRYLLQAADDPSLLVPVEDAWNPRGRLAGVLKRGAFNPREYLLSGLGQAAGISPRIEASLKSAAPAGYEVDTTGAYEFLTEKAWLLDRRALACSCPPGGRARGPSCA
jgi:hypothetical protein